MTHETNGQPQQGTEEMVQGDGFGLGASIDEEGDAVVLAWVYYEGSAIGVSFDPETARSMAKSVERMADEVEKMALGMREMTDDEVNTEIRKIAERLNDES